MSGKSLMDALLGRVEWREMVMPTNGDLVVDAAGEFPTATHEGVLEFAGFRFRCYQLSDGRRIVDADDLARALGLEDGAALERAMAEIRGAR